MKKKKIEMLKEKEKTRNDDAGQCCCNSSRWKEERIKKGKLNDRKGDRGVIGSKKKQVNVLKG